MHSLSDEISIKMHVRPRDENKTTLSLSELRNIQQNQTPEVRRVKYQQIRSKRRSEI